MNKSSELRYRVLHIENDVFLLNGFNQCCEDELGALEPRASMEIVRALTIEDAKSALNGETPRFDVLIVDLMLPRDKPDHEREETLQQDRRKLVKQLFEQAEAGPAGKTDDILALKQRIMQIDADLELLIVDDGGLEIVRDLVNKNNGRPIQRPVVFWTARGLPTIKEQCRALVDVHYVEICEKPVREIDVLKKVLELAGRMREGQRAPVGYS